MKKVTGKQIEKARRVTAARWSRISKAKTKDRMLSIINKYECGFCTLSTKLGYIGLQRCMNEKCPIRDEPSGCCCMAWNAYKGEVDINIIKKEAKALLKQMKDFDIPKIVKTINKQARSVKQ